MYILKIIAINIVLGLAFIISCKSEGALTPEDAFKSLKVAYSNSDAGGIVNILSRGSKDKVKEIIKMISLMDKVQLKSLSERFGVSIDKMKNLTITDYISIQLSISDKIGGDIIKDITNYKIIGIDKKDEKATIRVENGMELCFVREDSYWKFNMEKL